MVNLAAALAILFLGRAVFVPVAMAFVFAIVLRPLVRWLEGRGLPAPVSAGLIVLAGLGLLWGVGYALTPAVENFASGLPAVVSSASAKLRTLPRPLDRLGLLLSNETSTVERATVTPDTTGDSTRTRGRAPQRRPAPSAQANGNSSIGGVMPIIGKVFGTLADVVSSVLEITLLLLFFLAAGSSPRQRLVRRAARSAIAKALVDVGDEVQGIVSRYLTLLALINLVQATVITILMMLIGMPVPPVWGAMAFVAEFFPYLGGATMVVLLTLVGLASTNGPHVLLPPALYLLVTTIQNSLVSPVTYGRSLNLNPAAILVSVMMWWLIWGVPGAFLAVPILATIRVVCERQGGKFGALAALIEG